MTYGYSFLVSWLGPRNIIISNNRRCDSVHICYLLPQVIAEALFSPSHM